jgi:hypothetical protein
MARQYLILIADNGVIFPNNRNECQIAWVGFNGHLFRPTGGPDVLRRLHDHLLRPRHLRGRPHRPRRPGRRGEAGLAEVFREAGFTRFRRAKETPFNLILEARR